MILLLMAACLVPVEPGRRLFRCSFLAQTDDGCVSLFLPFRSSARFFRVLRFACALISQ